MMSNPMNQWLDEKWAIAFTLYVVVLLALSVWTDLQLLPPSLNPAPAYVSLAHFILMGIASYLSYLASRGRSWWVGRYALPLGPLLIAVGVVLKEILQYQLAYHPLNNVELAASVSGIVLFYRLARVHGSRARI